MRYIFAALFFLLIGTISCNYVKNVKLLTGGKLDRENFQQKIPFTYNKKIIVVEGQVNSDTTKRAFIFDTGAFNSKIEKSLADSLGLKRVATKDNSTAQGISREIEVTRLNSLKLGETIFRNIGAGKLEYDESSVSPCLAEHGLIGANLIKLAYWKIDYVNKELTFSDKAFIQDENKKTIQLGFDRPLLSGVPDVDIKIGEREVKNVLFDIGYNGGIILPRNLSSFFKSDEESNIIDYSTSGIYGTNLDTLTIKELEVGFDEPLATIPVEFSSLGKALIGNDFLEHFTVFINYKKKIITLQQESDIVIDEHADFIPGMLSEDLWIVNRVKEGSKLALGDTLSTVNEKKPKDIFSGKCDYFFGIRDFLDAEPLEVTTQDGKTIKLD
ncbi:MAG: aspartyl protease family protein [Balneola sp.]